MRFLSPTEVARKLDVKKDTVYGWLKTGQLQANRIGFSWQISEENVRALLQTRPWLSRRDGGPERELE